MLSLPSRDRAKRVWEAPSVHTACVTRCTPHPPRRPRAKVRKVTFKATDILPCCRDSVGTHESARAPWRLAHMFFDHRCRLLTHDVYVDENECHIPGNATNDANDAVTHMSSTCRSIRNYLPDRTDSTPSDLVDGHGRLAALTTNPVAAGITTCQPPTKPPCSSWHARASYRRTRPRVRNFPVDGERWSYANLTDAGSRHEPTIPRRRPCLNHVPT